MPPSIGFARRIVRFLVSRYYSRIEVTGAERIPQTGPVLLCANHCNSLIDPVIVGLAAARPVRFMAKAPLFEAPVLGRLMYALGMVPAFRGRDDASQVRRNLESLDEGAKVLEQGDALGIFPEGLSHDRTTVEMVRSGAARMALQAAAGAARDLHIVPIGLNYERKESFRSTIWVRVGEPIRMAEFLAAHPAEREARRALTQELEQRLKQVVIHLDKPEWEPFLNDLEVLAPQRAVAEKSRVLPIRRRKWIADAMNHFLRTDPQRVAPVAQSIRDYRTHVAEAGVRVYSAVLRERGGKMAMLLAWRFLWLVVLFLPALVGTLFHIVPFTIVRAAAARLRPPGRMTVSLYRLLIGLPVYLLWYAAAAWWLFHEMQATAWFGTTCLVLLPWLGLLALKYWRAARVDGELWWHQMRFLFRRDQLHALREEQTQIREQVNQLADEYDRVVPPPPPPDRPSRRQQLTRAAQVALAAVLLAAAGWYGAAWLRDRPIVDPEQGYALAQLSPAVLQHELERDEEALRAVIRGLDDLEADAVALQAEFAAGRRSYDNEADNDAVRQLLLAYINYRSALIRMVWKYGRHDQLAAEPDRLRAFLLDYTAACVLCESSLKFVHNFDRSPETIRRLNEGEPVWNIPAGLYDTIQHNLSSRESADLLASAGQLYEEQGESLERNGLGRKSAAAPFHTAIDRANATMDRLADPVWRQKARVATKDLAQLVSRVRYDSQSMISTWIGDVKIRNPRQGVSLIPAEHVERLRTLLKPGDVLIERRNWYMSNAFLPGYWPHAALYVGTAEDLQRMGLDQHPFVRPHWEEFARPDHEQHAHVIVEALSDGVVFASLEHSIGGGDSAAVLRPRLSEDQITEAIALAFSHAGKPYDFEFDFETHDKLVCTEVVYRAYGANLGPIHFPQKEILGRRTMPAIELVRKYRDEAGRPEAEFDFVAFIDGDEVTGAADFHDDPAVFVTTIDRPALTFLQGLDTAPFRGIGPFGWTMLGLIGVCSVGNLVVQLRAERPHTP